MYKLVFSRAAQKDIDRIDGRYKPHIFAALFDLKKDPYLGKRLMGKFKECYSLRVGVYRIIYKIYKKQLDILIIRIGHRQDIYR